jgi:hypothetical protein
MGLGALTCRVFGHHPDDTLVTPFGINVDGDFVTHLIQLCRRCGFKAEEFHVDAPIGVWQREDFD